MHFASNIKLLRARKKISQEEVSKALEIPRSTYSGYENETAEPSLGMLSKMAAFFNVSVDKLLGLNLTALPELQIKEIESGHDIDISGNKMRVLATTVNENNEDNIELVPVNARAGYTTGYSDPDYIKVLPTFSLPFLSKDRKYRSFPISGDSMPPVADGSYVTGEYVQNWNTIKNGYPYIIITLDEGIVFKQVYSKIKENGTLKLVSTNPLYEPYEIDIKNVLEVWKFVNFISKDWPEEKNEVNKLSETVSKLQQEIRNIKTSLKNNN
jgi:transcriptional regulator with XRE-family HTH domain